LVSAPAGSAVLVAGLALGKVAGETAIGSFVADVVLVPVVSRLHGKAGYMAASAVLAPIVAKRLMGNAPPGRPGASLYLNRLVLDRDTRHKPSGDQPREATN
jgi:hypothetical protein